MSCENERNKKEFTEEIFCLQQYADVWVQMLNMLRCGEYGRDLSIDVTSMVCSMVQVRIRSGIWLVSEFELTFS